MTSRKMGKYQEREKLTNLPYTIVGSNSLPKPIQSLTLKGAGLKAIAEQVGDEDLVHIEMWEDYTERGAHTKYYQRISVSKWEEKKND